MPGMLKDGVGRRRMAADDGCRWMILTAGDFRHCIFLIHRLPAASGVLWRKLVDAKVFWGIHRMETENLPDDDGEMPESTDFRWMNTEKPLNDGTKRVTSTDFPWIVDRNLLKSGRCWWMDHRTPATVAGFWSVSARCRQRQKSSSIRRPSPAPVSSTGSWLASDGQWWMVERHPPEGTATGGAGVLLAPPL
ncbi:hypothetical protein B0H12DRAFT_1078776 [Mycena haematopus]|nr:hypothetical protein B0H12DRAFT_1078776 [Mycena haematopus]